MSARRLHLDYVAPRWPAWPGWMVLALGAGLAAASIGAGVAARMHIAALEARLQPARAAPRIATPADPGVARRADQEAKAAAEAAQRLAFSWQPIFDAVEKAARPEVSLLALQPDPARGTVQISAEARDADAMLAYWRALDADAGLAAVHIAQYQVQEREPQQPIRFVLQAELRIGR